MVTKNRKTRNNPSACIYLFNEIVFFKPSNGKKTHTSNKNITFFAAKKKVVNEVEENKHIHTYLLKHLFKLHGLDDWNEERREVYERYFKDLHSLHTHSEIRDEASALNKKKTIKRRTG